MRLTPGAPMMTNDTDRVPEYDLIYQKMVELIKLIERDGRKVKGIHIEFESGEPYSAAPLARTFRSSLLTTEQLAAISKVLIEAGSETPFGADPVFELHPVDDEADEPDDFLTLVRDDKPPH